MILGSGIWSGLGQEIRSWQKKVCARAGTPDIGSIVGTAREVWRHSCRLGTVGVKSARLRHARGKCCKTGWEHAFRGILAPRKTEILHQMSDMVMPVLERWLTRIRICERTDRWQAFQGRKTKSSVSWGGKIRNSDLGIIGIMMVEVMGMDKISQRKNSKRRKWLRGQDGIRDWPEGWRKYLERGLNCKGQRNREFLKEKALSIVLVATYRKGHQTW